ncbi:MAG: Txe/YoeB family addiction module toxin [Prevotellaceae bacterium]|jgi:toxin YoeB|nr:Txe/YoeB family addiction module toxin [Prevotellaceae bacterium]
MKYEVVFPTQVVRELKFLKKSEPQAFGKAMNLVAELREHPETGTGHPKPLGGDRVGQWSRRITDKHRLTYQIDKEEKIVEVISARGHYDDK